MNKLGQKGALFLIILFISACQINLPFNRASEKLVKVAKSYELKPNEEIVIGEFQDAAYKVYVKNKAKTYVLVYLIDRNTNKYTQTFQLDSGANATILAAKFEKVIFQNTSGEAISLDIGLNTDVEGWRTQPLKSYDAE